MKDYAVFTIATKIENNFPFIIGTIRVFTLVLLYYLSDVITASQISRSGLLLKRGEISPQRMAVLVKSQLHFKIVQMYMEICKTSNYRHIADGVFKQLDRSQLRINN